MHFNLTVTLNKRIKLSRHLRSNVEAAHFDFTESQKKNSVECHDTNPQIKLKVSHTEMSSS